MRMKIAVFDDEKRQRKRWHKHLEELNRGDDVLEMHPDEFRGQVDALESRRRESRNNNVKTVEECGKESEFDTIDILIVDYDLLQSMELSGEDIAYLVRCYSKCGLVLALNQFGDKRFDLTLQRHPESFADLNIGETYLNDPGLWGDEGWRQFRPWHWPLLPDLLVKHRKRVDQVREWIEQPILNCLSLDDESVGILPRKTLEFIQCPSIDVEATSFEDFVMCSGKGLKRRDAEGAIDELKPQIASARLHSWLESFVLGAQDILVDAPHLAVRFPSLLEGPITELTSWNETAKIPEPGGIDRQVLKKLEFPHSHWLSRTSWYWVKARAHEAIQEVADPWSIEEHDYVFCEDTSRFSPREEAHSFVVDLPTKFNRRYVAKVGQGEIEYHPNVRLSL